METQLIYNPLLALDGHSPEPTIAINNLNPAHQRQWQWQWQWQGWSRPEKRPEESITIEQMS